VPPPSQVFFDSTDVLFQADLTTITTAVEQRLREAKADLLFSAEAYCFPCSKTDRATLDRRASNNGADLFKYLNSGGYAGRAGALRKAYRACLEQRAHIEVLHLFLLLVCTHCAHTAHTTTSTDDPLLHCSYISKSGWWATPIRQFRRRFSTSVYSLQDRGASDSTRRRSGTLQGAPALGK
jgi:hypothetical protein